VFEQPSQLALEIAGRHVALGPDWKVWQGRDQPAAWSQRVNVEGLQPGRRYPVRLVSGTTELATGEAVTLPGELPPLGAKPFTCLLGSCFAHLGDAAGAAGAAYASMPGGSRPDVKLLTGDQVYLDAPFPRHLYNVVAGDDLRAELLATYLATWTQGGDGRGFSELLRRGATYFTSDDHEIWNNAPLPTATVRATWWPFGDRGAAWLRLATELYDGFQAPPRERAFTVGPLSVRIVDTRLGRTMDRARFVPQEELLALAAWVDALAGPGVLVIGQPIFVEPAGFRGNFTDFGLADFGQYHDLVRILTSARHDVLVLTGDVHYGRISGCSLAGGASLIEVIASPFGLVDARVGGRWHAPPAVFPVVPVPGTTQRSIWHEPEHQLAANHFATLEFSADGTHVLTSIRAWPIPAPGQPPSSRLVFQRRLH
jgi:hypothetical protein